MGIREWAHDHPKVTFPLLGTCLACCIAGIAVEVLGKPHTINTKAPDHYYTVDDGKTFFQASQTNVPPFDYNGQTAVRACVFSCTGHLFVGYLERYTTQAHQKELGPERGAAELEINGRELKKPGDINWVSSSDRTAVVKVTKVMCPDGLTDVPVPVEP